MPAAKVGGRFRRGGQASGKADKISDTTRSAMVDETERHRMSSPTGLRRETDGENGRRLGVRMSVRQKEETQGRNSATELACLARAPQGGCVRKQQGLALICARPILE